MALDPLKVISPKRNTPPAPPFSLVIVSCEETVILFPDWVTVVAPPCSKVTSPLWNVPAASPFNLVIVSM